MGWQEIGRESRGVRSPADAPLLRQTYTADGVDPLPEGVVVVPQRVWPDDAGGTFKEVVRIDAEGILETPALRERGVLHQPAQVNISVINPGTRRFWHVHPTQGELWTVAHGQLNAGLVDCRKSSATFGRTAKVVLTPHQAVYIPAGVAHGYANESGGVVVLQYFPDRQFARGDESEEWRISPDALSFDFVLAETM